MSTPSEGTNVEPSVSRGSKRKKSVVWQHMERNENDESLATCNHCKKVLSCPGKNGTSHLLKHLRGGCRIFTLPTTNSRVATPRAQFTFDQMRSRKLIAIACIKHKYPFNIAEHDYFELFLRSLQPDFSLQCRNRLRGDVIEVYREETTRLYQMLERLDCRVSLTTDIWTSNHNDNAYMCVTCHYIDGDWKLQKKIIAFKVVNAPHTGDKLFNYLRDVILEWNLDGKLCSVVVDNASNNDVCVTLMKNWLLTDYRTLLGGELLHVRCSAHILNLIVQDGLSKIRSSIENVRDTVRYLNKSIGLKEAFDRVKRQCGLEKERELAMVDDDGRRLRLSSLDETYSCDSASEGYIDGSADDDDELCYASGDTTKLQFRKEASKAHWIDELGMAELVEKKGRMWTNTGITRAGKTYCSIEETLYLAEIGALDVFNADDTPIFLSDLYGKLTEDKGRYGCSWESFEVYRHLKFLGYIVGRHDIPWSSKNIKKTPDDQETDPDNDKERDKELVDKSLITEMLCNLEFCETRPIFDVYPPNSKFKKSSPGSPLFALVLIGGQPPTIQEIKDLEARFKEVPSKFCIVEHGRVSFLSFTKIELPVLP